MGKGGTPGRRGRTRATPPQLGSLDPADTASIERQVYRLLRRAIMAGQIAPGSGLTGRSLADSLAISPSPVRDALKRLEADGVIESRNKSAYFVSELSREQYLDIINLRIQIEGYAAGEAARHASAEDVARIEAIHRRYTQTQSFAESVRVNYFFHFEIYKLARSPILIEVTENLWMRIGPIMQLHMHGYGVGDVADSHERLIEAIRRGDVRSATRALERDLTVASRVIAPSLPSRKLADESRGGLLATLDI